MPATKKTKPRKTKTAVKSAVVKKVVRKTGKKAVKKAIPETKAQTKAKKISLKPKQNKVVQTVILPETVSAEMKEKSNLLHSLIDDMRIPMYRIAYVSAFGFMLVGVSALLIDFIPNTYSQSAQICTATQCGTTGNTAGTTSTSTGNGITDTSSLSVIPDPVFDLLNSLPEQLQGEKKVSFVVLNSQQVYAELLNTSNGEVFRPVVTRLSNQNFQIVLNSLQLSSGTHGLKIYAKRQNNNGTVAFNVGGFIVEPIINATTTNTNTETTATDTSTSSQTSNASDNASTTDLNLPAATSTAESENIVTEASEEVVEVVPEKILTTEFRILPVSQPLKNRQVVNVVAPDAYTKIELYVRPELALQSRFLGTMKRESKNFIYAFDSNNLPNGNYELFAVSKLNEVTHTTKSYNIKIFNQRVEISDTTSETNSTSTEIVIEEPMKREFYTVQDELNSTTTLNESVVADDLVKNKTRELITENRTDFNDLLQRYSIALQTNNSILLEAIEDEINKKRESLITTVVQDSSTKGVVAQIDSQLLHELSELKGRVAAFENIRQSRVDDSARSDSDGDGISDYDEVNVYKTNPQNPDTDQDGFIDGAEIIRGFNPSDPEPEALVNYELPNNTVGLKRADVLEITGVKPLIELDSSQKIEQVKAEITGFGLPNSYVTIYVFSSPTIVTVKTDADGSFAYRFDKELEDGSHEVFVAFTDNTGSILAHSESFQFIKQAQAFTPVDASAESVSVTAPTIVENTTNDSIRLVLAMSILVLGFFLLMLGISMRQTEKQINDVSVAQ